MAVIAELEKKGVAARVARTAEVESIPRSRWGRVEAAAAAGAAEAMREGTTAAAAEVAEAAVRDSRRRYKGLPQARRGRSSSADRRIVYGVRAGECECGRM